MTSPEKIVGSIRVAVLRFCFEGCPRLRKLLAHSRMRDEMKIG
jgi:hypothetical protein